MLRRTPSGVSRLTFVIVLLVLTLGLAAALAWQAHQAARSHRDVAERVARDYVEFAGWEFSRAARRELDTTFERWLGVLVCAAGSPALPPPSGLATRQGCSCEDLNARALFRLDLPDGTMDVTGESLDDDSRRAVLAAIAPAATPSAIHGPRVVRLISIGGRIALVAAQGVHKHGTKLFVAGFVADPDALAPAFRKVIQKTPLLPPALAAAGNEMLGIRVRTRTGVPVFVTGAFNDSFRADGTLEDTVGGLFYDVSLDAKAAGRLVIGGLPRSRLPLLLGLLALTAGLVVVAALQLRREHELARLRGDFVSSVSHELRTPLAQIRLFSETLLLGRVRSEAEGRRSLEIIQQEARRLTHLVENVLYFSRSERGTVTVSAAPERLGDLIAQAIEAFAPLARSGRSEVRFDLREDVVVPVDPGALRQILLNLLDNAVKYGRSEQTIVVTLDRAGGHAVLSVEDEGSGVPAEARDRIWEPYARLAEASASAIAGAGIGLSVVRDLTVRHGGTCRVEGSPRGGARFVVELPAARPARGPEAQPAEGAAFERLDAIQLNR
jgi:signal transduction histidine kinase